MKVVVESQDEDNVGAKAMWFGRMCVCNMLYPNTANDCSEKEMVPGTAALILAVAVATLVDHLHPQSSYYYPILPMGRRVCKVPYPIIDRNLRHENLANSESIPTFFP
jgi:hypothetical protein